MKKRTTFLIIGAFSLLIIALGIQTETSDVEDALNTASEVKTQQESLVKNEENIKQIDGSKISTTIFFDATPDSYISLGLGHFDIKNDLLVWIDHNTGHPSLRLKNLTSGEIMSIEFQNNEIENPHIAGKYVIFERRMSPKNVTELHVWNPNTNITVMITCGWPSPAGKILFSEDTWVVFGKSADYLVNVANPRECNLYRKMIVKEGTEVIETVARYVGPDYSPLNIVEDSNPALPLIPLCAKDSCYANTRYMCPEGEQKLACTGEEYIGKPKAILSEKGVLVMSGKGVCFTYRFKEYSYMTTNDELLQAVRFGGVECEAVIDDVALVISFNEERLEFDLKEYKLTETPNYPNYGINNYRKVKYDLEALEHKELLKQLKTIPIKGYSKCSGKKDGYGWCTEWDTFVAVYIPEKDKTVTFYGGRFRENSFGYGRFEGDIDYKIHTSSSIVSEGEFALNRLKELAGTLAEGTVQHYEMNSSNNFVAWQNTGWLDEKGKQGHVYVWKLPTSDN